MKFPIASYPSPKIPSSNEEFKEQRMVPVPEWYESYNKLKESIEWKEDGLLIKYPNASLIIPEPPLDKSRIEMAIKKAVREWFPNMSDRLMDAIVKDFKEDIGWV